MTDCPLCNEPVLPGEDARDIGTEAGRLPAHRECLLRSVVGGIGHFEDHYMYCIGMRDPDGGRTYRQSALEVDAWVHEHGMESASPTPYVDEPPC